MLKVPELQPHQEPFDPGAVYPRHPDLNVGNHALTVSRKNPDSAIRFDDIPAAPDTSQLGDEDAALDRILDNTLVKEAITSLHIEDDREREKLLAYEPAQICDIVPDYVKFAAAQKKKFDNMLRNNNQRHFFNQATASYFSLARPRAYALRTSRILHLQQETIEKQNREFLARALRPENITNDLLQTQYRNMILHNLDLLVADRPAEERQKILDEAGKDFYSKIMDARLAVNHSSLKPMLDSPAIRRVFSKDELDKYRGAMKAAAANKEISATAFYWVEKGITPDDVGSAAEKRYSNPEEQKQAIELYTRFRYNAKRGVLLRAILDMDKAWRVVKEAEYDFSVIPEWVKNGDSELYAFIVETLDARETAGGIAPEPKRTRLCQFVGEFSPSASAESLARRSTLYTLVRDLGGPDSDAFQTVLRLLLGKTTLADRNWFDALEYARRLFTLTKEDMDSLPDEREEAFLAMFDKARRLKLERDEVDELDPLAIDELARKCLAIFH